MRYVRSSGSAKAICLEREEVLSRLRRVAKKAKQRFPEITDIRLFGSFPKAEESGTSDLDILIIANTKEPDPIERIRPYFYFFSEHLPLALDVLVLWSEEAQDLGNRFGFTLSLLSDT